MAFFALTAFIASDASIAGGYPGAETAADAVTVSPNITTAAPAIAYDTAAISFAPSQEVTQPLGTESANPQSLAALVGNMSMPAVMDEETRCLAGAVYFEAKSESFAGQLAVAHVVINRARSGRFADSLCGVVYQPGQFSFVRGRSMPAINTASRDWQEATAIAQIALAKSWDNPVEGALYFHAKRVSPAWKLKRIAAIDNHIFYR